MRILLPSTQQLHLPQRHHHQISTATPATRHPPPPTQYHFQISTSTRSPEVTYSRSKVCSHIITNTFPIASDVSIKMPLNSTSATLLPGHSPHPATCYQPGGVQIRLIVAGCSRPFWRETYAGILTFPNCCKVFPLVAS